MIWLLMALLMMYAAFLEITVKGELQHAEETQARLCVKLGGVRRLWNFRLVRTAEGHRLVVADAYGARAISADAMQGKGSSGWTEAIRQARGARRFLLRHLHWETVEGLVLLRMDNAAHAALLCGAAAGTLACFPWAKRLHVRILPEFFRPHSTVQLKCIVRVKVGILILTAGMLLLTWLGMHHPKESEESAYGTSHR